MYVYPETANVASVALKANLPLVLPTMLSTITPLLIGEFCCTRMYADCISALYDTRNVCADASDDAEPFSVASYKLFACTAADKVAYDVEPVGP